MLVLSFSFYCLNFYNDLKTCVPAMDEIYLGFVLLVVLRLFFIQTALIALLICVYLLEVDASSSIMLIKFS